MGSGHGALDARRKMQPGQGDWPGQRFGGNSPRDLTVTAPPGTKGLMRSSHAIAAAFVVLLALVLWLVSGGEPPPVAGPGGPKASAEPAAVETASN
jgi:hypothetical protein